MAKSKGKSRQQDGFFAHKNFPYIHLVQEQTFGIMREGNGMRKISLMPMTFGFILLLTSCNKVNFNKSRTGNESELILKYSILIGIDSQALEWKKGILLTLRLS